MAAGHSDSRIVWTEGEQYEVILGTEAAYIGGGAGAIGAVAGVVTGGVLGCVLGGLLHSILRSPSPQRYKCTIKCTKGRAVVSCVCRNTLYLQNYEGARIKAWDVLPVTASLQCIQDNSITDCDIRQASQFRSCGREISYTPQTRGRHELTVKVLGEHIRGSPFTVFVEVPPTSLGDPIRIIRGVAQPTSLAIGPNSECVVVETRGNRVSVFDSKGKKLTTLGSSSQGQTFDMPSGVSLDSSSNVYVVGRQKISKFSPLGKPMKSLSWQQPASMEVLPGISSVGDQLYVYNVSKNEIMRLDQGLTAVSESFKVSMESETLEPRNVQSDSSGGTARSFVRPQGDRRMQRQEETNVTLYVAGKTFQRSGDTESVIAVCRHQG